MRIISFTKMWEKLKQSEFTTFRFPRGDKDWQEGETIQVYYKNRSPHREKLGEAEVIKVEPRRVLCSIPNNVPQISDEEAKSDGFENFEDMVAWIKKTYGGLKLGYTMNKLTLRWTEVRTT